MSQTHPSSTGALWARFRFSVVGSLLSSPPGRGALKTAIRVLAAKTWSHPVNGRDVCFSAVTIERWYYTARRHNDDPVGVLRRAVRKDRGKVSLPAPLAERLILQYRDYPHWSYQLHYDNLAVLAKADLSLGILDDHSRLCCHVQWYLSETAEDLVHGLSQAIQKRGLPRALLTDNGSAMVAEEVTEGLLRLGIVHERTLPYSPYQNGKQEAFWGRLEGRLLKMVDGVTQLTLKFLNEVTQAWMEIEYNRVVHRETSCSPVERFASAPDVLRSSPSSESLRDAFRLETKRIQRQSDGTISLEGVRFEIPSRYHHFRELTVRYARWNLGRIDLVDDRNGTILAPIYPLDKSANADGRRALVEPNNVDAPPDSSQHKDGELPPLLKKILEEYSATGMPPAYLPKTSPSKNGEDAS
jgi:putative transposase